MVVMVQFGLYYDFCVNVILWDGYNFLRCATEASVYCESSTIYFVIFLHKVESKQAQPAPSGSTGGRRIIMVDKGDGKKELVRVGSAYGKGRQPLLRAPPKPLSPPLRITRGFGRPGRGLIMSRLSPPRNRGKLLGSEVICSALSQMQGILSGDCLQVAELHCGNWSWFCVPSCLRWL